MIADTSTDSMLSNEDLRRYFFDEQWIARRHPECIRDMQSEQHESPWEWYNATGYCEVDRPSPAFSSEVYISNGSGYALDSGLSPLRHYQAAATGTRASPCLLFDERFYQQRYADIRAAIEEKRLPSGLIHFLSFEQRERRRPHPLFGPQIPVLLKAGTAPEALDTVLREKNIDPMTLSGLFDPDWYRYAAMDVELDADSRESVLEHYIVEGLQHGVAPIPDFDAEYYCASHPEVKAAIDAGTIGSAIWHWLFHGAQSDAAPNNLFDSAYYLAKNPSARGEIIRFGLLCAFEHFLLVGRARGWKCKPPLMSLDIPESAGQVSMARRAAITASQVARYRKIRFRQFADPEISVVLPVRDQFDFTIHILAQLSRATDAAVEVIVVDNGSDDRTRNLDRFVSGVTIIRSETNLGFPAGCNVGAKRANAPVLLILNNDIELGFGAIDQALHTLRSDSTIAAVGGRIVRSHGMLQEAGSMLFSDGSSSGIGRDANPLDSRFATPRDVDFCSACFLMLRTDVFTETGGFDEAFSPGYYEETDLCLRIQQAGHRVVYDPSALVFHYEYGSFSSGRPRSVSTSLIRRNQETFVAKHMRTLSSLPLPGARLSPQPVAPGQQRILMIEDYAPIAKLGSGFGRANLIAVQLSEMGHAVEVLALFEHEAADADSVFDGLPGIAVHHLGGLHNADAFLSEYGSQFDVIWLCRTHNAQRLAQPLRKMRSQARKPQRVILDTEALATNREREMARVLGPEPWSEDTFAQRLAKELRTARMFDAVVTVNQAEADLVRSVSPGSDVFVVSNHGNAVPGERSYHQCSGFLFLGAIHAAGTPNFDSMEWFCTEVWPRVHKSLPNACLTIAGFWNNDVAIPEWMRDTSIIHAGTVENVSPLLQKSRVFVAPTRFSAGIPIKIIESAQHGLPCVVSEVLAGQLDWGRESQAMVSALAPSVFSRKCVALHEDPNAWNAARSRLLNWVESRFSTSRFRQSINAALAAEK